MDQIREKGIGSVPNPRQAQRATTANKNDMPTHKHHRRIVSVGKEETGIGKGGGECTHSVESVVEGEMVSGGTFAMGSTNKVYLLDSVSTTVQQAPGTDR